MRARAALRRTLPLLAVLSLLAAVPAGAQMAAQNQGLVARDDTIGSAAAPLDVAGGVDSLGAQADYLITADLGEQRGGNLFHSFSRFGIGADETATFTEQGALDPAAIEHVITRVTGGSLSRIDGTLRSTIPGADVWLINPNGLVFGAGARLDVPGSFHASTGDFLAFDDAGLARVYANPLQPSVLSIAEPRAFGFLSASGAAPISLEPGASLEVGAGESFELSAGDISLISAQILAPGAHVMLEAQETVTLACSAVCTTGSKIDVSGAPPGTVAIRAGRIVVQGGPDVTRHEQRSLVLAHNTSTTTGSRGVLGPGAISLDARESVLVDNGLLWAVTTGAGNAGGIRIASPRVTMQRGHDPFWPGNAATFRPVGANVGTLGAGDAGRIRIEAESVTLENGVGLGASSLGGSGAAGSIEITAHDLFMADLAVVSAVSLSGSGDAGTLAFNLGENGALHADGSSRKVRIVSGTTTSGDGGSITIQAGSLELEGDADVSSSAWAGDGASGSIGIRARTLSLEGAGIGAPEISTSTFGPGDGGNLAIEADSVFVSGGASITASTAGAGDGGDITIEADSVSVSDSGEINTNSAAFTQGDAGSIFIRTGSLSVANLGRITSSTQGSGSAGNLIVSARDSIVLRDGGLFPLRTEILDPLKLTGVFSAAALGGGRAGYITLDAPEITVAGGAIAATATVSGGGAGGDISLRGDRIRVLDGGIVSASSLPLVDRGVFIADSGNAGSVTLVASRSIEIAGHHALSAAQRSTVASNVVARVDGQPGTGGARAGRVVLDAPRILIHGGEVLASAPDSDGGDIEIVARDRVHLIGGTITTSVGDGVGGNITIDPTFVILQDDARIESRAGGGTGGTIQITAENLFQFPGTLISADADASKLGIDGTVGIHAPDVDLSGALTALPASFVDASSLLRERCAARRSGERAGSFTVRGVGGVGAGPDAPLVAATFSTVAQASVAHAADRVPAEPDLRGALLASNASCN